MCLAEPFVSGCSTFEVELVTEIWKGINIQVWLKFWQNLSKQEVKH
jgi:hypothetical protein